MIEEIKEGRNEGRREGGKEERKEGKKEGGKGERKEGRKGLLKESTENCENP